MLKVTEIFYSLQGETKTVGLPTVFVRLTGCPMRCAYCDTDYAFHGGKKLDVDQIIQQVRSYQAKHVTITGGEPLVQKQVYLLMQQLCDLGYVVSLETGNAVPFAAIDERVYIVLDIKTPGSKEEGKNCYQNIEQLKPTDAIKFVICDEVDYQWSVNQVKERALDERCEVLFSPSANQLCATDLAEWILRDQLNVRFQIQLHKVLWNDAKGK